MIYYKEICRRSKERKKKENNFVRKEEFQRKKLLLERLKEYHESGCYPFHMPGHKRQCRDEIVNQFPNPFAIDITEIEGFDNLHHPEDVLKESMEWAASVYGSDKTYYLVNGSSCGILSAISASVRPGGTLLMSRNCHKSVYHGVILNQLKSLYLYPQIMEEFGIQGAIDAKAVDKALKEHPEIQAVLVVSPTYDGVTSDIREIAQIVHQYKIPLIVDEAHGAHFSFGELEGGERLFPQPAIQCGADLVIQSLHKTLPSLTQTAVLHMRRGYVDEKRLERYLQIYQSSSPSYVFMAGIENCIYEMNRNGKQRMGEFRDRLMRLRERLSQMKHLKLLSKKSRMGGGCSWDLDLSKIVISCRNCSRIFLDGKDMPLDGEQLMDWLRSQYRLELEMCGADYVVAITTMMDTEEGLMRLADAFLKIDGALKLEQKKTPEIRIMKAEVVMPIKEAADAPSREIEISQAAGKISAEFVYLYPPGIPIVTPGERISDEIAVLIQRYKSLGLPVQGMADPSAERIHVVERGPIWERFTI